MARRRESASDRRGKEKRKRKIENEVKREGKKE
jgi:hypothetical protein